MSRKGVGVMEKMKLETANVVANNVERIGELFPNCITESKDEHGQLKRAINFEMLRQMLSEDVVDGKEAYEFTWVGKKASIVEANKPIRKTLRPCKEDSVNWDTTENLYIEGDNLQVLKLLQESYLGKVKMIYIDPPYNTGSDFIYNDDFKMNRDDYAEEIGEYDDVGNRMFENKEGAGRFHSDWCSMLYSRLLLSRNLLREDGIIAISINEIEINNLLNIIRELFGDNNYDILIWRKTGKQGNTKKITRFKNTHEYIVVAYKNRDRTVLGKMKILPKWETTGNPDNDPRGNWMSGNISNEEEKSNPNSLNYYTVITPSGRHITREWFFSQEVFNKLSEDKVKNQDGKWVGRIYYGIDGNNIPRIKRFEEEEQEFYFDSIMDSLGTFTDAKEELTDILGDRDYFDTPKPIKLIQEIIRVSTSEDDIIIDYFSGSSTTANSLIKLNLEDSTKRNFIMVQLPEDLDERHKKVDSSEKKIIQKQIKFLDSINKPHTICEIGKERIRRAGQKILSENADKEGIENLDIGFRVLKLDDTNMKDVYYAPQAFTQEMLPTLEENVKEDRTDLDLLFGCLLEWGLPLSLPYASETVDGCKLHNYNDGDLIACFDAKVPDAVIRHIAKLQPLRAVFRDSSFADSPSKINVGEIFKALAPDTRIKVI